MGRDSVKTKVYKGIWFRLVLVHDLCDMFT